LAFRQNASPAVAEPPIEEYSRANLSNKESGPNRGRIATTNANEVKYLSGRLGVSREESLRAVDKVGNSTLTVRKELGK
jgi:Protein of unknown function (DUF3606)